MAVFPIISIFVCLIPNFNRAVIRMFNCLLIDKEEIIVLFPDNGLPLSKVVRHKKIITVFIPNLKSGILLQMQWRCLCGKKTPEHPCLGKQWFTLDVTQIPYALVLYCESATCFGCDIKVMDRRVSHQCGGI